MLKKIDNMILAFVAVLFLLPMLIPTCSDGGLEKKPWQPYLDPREGSNPGYKREVRPKGFEYDWEKDAKEGTARWDEFLEEIENRGLSPYDPEAIEIWDGNYN